MKGTRARRAHRCSIRKSKYDGSAVNICLSTNRLVEKRLPPAVLAPRSSVAGDQPAVQFRGARGSQTSSAKCGGPTRGRLGLRPKPTLFKDVERLRQTSLPTLNMSAIDRNPPLRQLHVHAMMQPGRSEKQSPASSTGAMSGDPTSDLRWRQNPPYSAASACFFSGRPSRPHTSTSASARPSINSSVW
jgi:hypothetical protein